MTKDDLDKMAVAHVDWEKVSLVAAYLAAVAEMNRMMEELAEVQPMSGNLIAAFRNLDN